MTNTEFSLQLLKAKYFARAPETAFEESEEGYIQCCFATGMGKLKKR